MKPLIVALFISFIWINTLSAYPISPRPLRKLMQESEWLVKCAEHPATRWEGTFELSPSSDFMSYYSREKSEPFQYVLSAAQKQRLKQALLSTEDPQYCNFALVDLVYPGNEAEIRSFLLKGLKHLQANRLWLAESYMTRLLYTKDSPEMKALVDDFSDILFETDKKEQRQSIVSKFLVLAEL